MQNLRGKRLAARENEIKSRLPWKAGIYLPTAKLPLEDRVRGLEHVLKIWENDWPNKYSHELRGLRDKYSNRSRCFIIGNGPSLNETNLDLLIDEVTFGVNGIFLKFPETRFRPTFYVVEDHLVAEDRRDEINDLAGPIKLFPIYNAYCLHEGPNTVFFNHRPRVSFPHGFDFSTDASKVTYTGCTVTFTCMQLAFYFGFKEIYLVGVDHNYEMPKDIRQENVYGTQILDMSSHDPNHFHPNYFGKGRRWHDPQVGKMEEAYKEALKVTRSHGVQIVNATIGGKLEVFPRADYYSLFDSSNRTRYSTAGPEDKPSGPIRVRDYEGTREKDREMSARATEFPRVLVIDMTRIGGESATGQLKKTLFADWPQDRLMQVSSEGRGIFGVYRETETGATARVTRNTKELMAACQLFAPDVIYYRPVDLSLHLHDFALRVIERLDVPLVTCIVDDWPERLKHKRPKLYKKLDASLRGLLARSYACLSICDEMSIAFQERYGVSFTAVANGIDPCDWTALDQERGQRASPGGPFLIRYVGGLADDKELQSILDVAQLIDSLQNEGIDVRLEVHTTPIWASKLRLLSDLKGVSGDASFLPEDEYRKLLVSCDALLIAYNFDERSIGYVRYSMANSLPEYMASAVPILAYGPLNVATISYVASWQFAHLVTQRDEEKLSGAIAQLISDTDYGRNLGDRARQLAFERHARNATCQRFHSILRQAATSYKQSRPGKAVQPTEEVRSSTGKGGLAPVAQSMAGARERSLYARLVGYLKTHYPTIITIGRFAKWGLSKFKRSFLGAGGIALLVIVGLYVAGALIAPLRWYLVGIATALLLLGGAVLALSYGRSILNRFINDQRRSIQGMREQSIKDRTQLQASLDRLTKEISDSRDTLAKLNVGNFPLFQQFNRRLTNEDLKRFAAEWAPKLGLDLNARALAYIAHRICLAEDTCVGRLAGNIETMLLRVLVARSVKEPDLEVLEIGTLFGVGAAMIHENCQGFFGKVHLTLIDPLSGYYSSHQVDIMTKMPVTREIFVHNMQRMNIPESDYTVIEKLSTEDEAIEQASKRRYNLLIIDGDHSYFGVKHDFCSYRHLVKRGGYIIFDDYGNPNWSEIKDFVDKEVAGLPELEFVGTDVHTAVFRVIADDNSVTQ